MTDRPFRDEPTEVLETALGLADTHAEQAARFQPVQPDAELPAVSRLFRAELQRREGTVTMTNPPDDERRDRYAAAIAKRDGHEWPTEFEDDERNYRRRADAAMAVADAEIEHLRKSRDAFRDQRNAVFATNEKLLAQIEESDQARIRAENEVRTVKRASAAPPVPAATDLRTLVRGVIRDCPAEFPDDLADRVWAALAVRPRFDAQAGLQRLADAVERGEAVAEAPAPTDTDARDRATVLAEVEAMVRKEIRDCGYPLDGGCEFCNGVTTVLEKVRRMADEAQQPSAYRQLLAKLEAERAGLLAADAPCHEVGIAVSGLAGGYRHAILWAIRHFEGDDAYEQYLRDHANDLGPDLRDAFPARQACTCGQPREHCDVGGEAADRVLDERVAAAKAEAEAFGPEVVAYRNSDRPGVLLCREHGDGWMGLTPLTSDELPDGGLCTECGVDVLIPQQQAGEGR